MSLIEIDAGILTINSITICLEQQPGTAAHYLWQIPLMSHPYLLGLACLHEAGLRATSTYMSIPEGLF